MVICEYNLIDNDLMKTSVENGWKKLYHKSPGYPKEKMWKRMDICNGMIFAVTNNTYI